MYSRGRHTFQKSNKQLKKIKVFLNTTKNKNHPLWNILSVMLQWHWAVCSEATAGPWFWRAEPCCKIPERCNIQKMSDHVSETCSTQRPHVPCNTTPTSFLWFPQRPMTDFIPGLSFGVHFMQFWGQTPHVWPSTEQMLMLLMTFSSAIAISIYYF